MVPKYIPNQVMDTCTYMLIIQSILLSQYGLSADDKSNKYILNNYISILRLPNTIYL